MKKSFNTELTKLVLLFILAILLVSAFSIGAGFGFHALNGIWHKKTYAKEVSTKDKAFNKDEIVVMSYNIRNTYQDKLGDKRWEIRFPLILNNIRNVMPDIFGLQEICKDSDKDLARYLKGYDSFGAYRSDEKNDEKSAIYFRSDRFKMVKQESFWISETPEKMSVGWDAALPRVCVYVQLEDKDGTMYYVFNTHLDHRGVQSRIKGIELVMYNIERLGATNVILLGDLNFEENSQEYKTLTEYMSDAKYGKSEGFVRINEGNTYHGYSQKKEKGEQVDYISYMGVGEPVSYGLITKRYNNVYPSDHYPIVVKFKK